MHPCLERGPQQVFSLRHFDGEAVRIEGDFFAHDTGLWGCWSLAFAVSHTRQCAFYHMNLAKKMLK
jgi:NADPH-dependent ferric siderophore reductase